MLYSTMGHRVAGNVYSTEKESKQDKEGGLEYFRIKCKTPKILKEHAWKQKKNAQEGFANQLNNKKDYIVHGIKGPSWFGLLEHFDYLAVKNIT